MNITDICTRVDAQNERSRLVNSVFIRHFQVDEHTVIMTMSRRNFRKASMTCQWTPTKNVSRRKAVYRYARLRCLQRRELLLAVPPPGAHWWRLTRHRSAHGDARRSLEVTIARPPSAYSSKLQKLPPFLPFRCSTRLGCSSHSREISTRRSLSFHAPAGLFRECLATGLRF